MSAFDYRELVRLCPDSAVRAVAAERGLVPTVLPERPQSWFNDARGILRQARLVRAEACHRCGKHPALFGGICYLCSAAAKQRAQRTRRRAEGKGEGK